MTTAVDSNTHEPTLYRHTKCSDWGLGILAYEGPDRKTFQFQDGELRTIKEGYYHLVEEVKDPPENAEQVLAELMRGLEHAEAAKMAPSKRAAKKSAEPAITLDEQNARFTEAYPSGFEDEKWEKDVRGQGASRRIKSHRDPVLEQARLNLAQGRLTDAMSSEDKGEILKRVCKKVLRATDLVSVKTDVRPLEDLEGGQRDEALDAIYALLHGEEPVNVRVDRFRSALQDLGVKVTWALPTALLGLVHPDEHIAVKPTTVRKQAKRLAPNLKLGTYPSGRSYSEVLDMARSLRRQLEDAGLKPRDMMDVLDYMSVSLRS